MRVAERNSVAGIHSGKSLTHPLIRSLSFALAGYARSDAINRTEPNNAYFIASSVISLDCQRRKCKEVPSVIRLTNAPRIFLPTAELSGVKGVGWHREPGSRARCGRHSRVALPGRGEHS